MTLTTAVTDIASNTSVPETVINVERKERAASNAGALSAAQIPKLTITWENINFNVKIKDPATKRLEEKKILQEVSGEAAPGELLVLMGPSGAGKSTLLDCILARNRQCTGNILVNGKKWSKEIAHHSCYAMQDDLFYVNLTVVEHLTFQAELRMAKISTKEERKERVLSIISELGLKSREHAHWRCARERAIGSFMAETVVILMRDLARMGRTVIATIHQPSPELFEIFDKLYLLVDGCAVYNGKASESIEYFGKQGLQCPSFMSPTDYFMKQLVAMDDQPGSRERVRNLAIAWQRHAQQRSQLKRGLTETNLALDKESETEYAPGIITQILVLCKRNWLRLVRDAIGFKARIGSTLFIAIMIGLIFRRLKHDQKGIQDFTGAIFFTSVNQLFSSANPEFISVPLEIPLVMREHNGGLYNVLVWYFAKNISDLSFQLFFQATFLPHLQLRHGTRYMVSCLAKRVDLAPILGILLILPFLLFGGLFLNSDSTPKYFVWLQQISPIKYCFHTLMRAYWSRIDSIACDASVQRCLADNSVKLDHMDFDCIVLVVLNVAFRLVGALSLWRRTDKRVPTN
ncbi:Atp-binding protein, partial [Globisporangium splendens]